MVVLDVVVPLNTACPSLNQFEIKINLFHSGLIVTKKQRSRLNPRLYAITSSHTHTHTYTLADLFPNMPTPPSPSSGRSAVCRQGVGQGGGRAQGRVAGVVAAGPEEDGQLRRPRRDHCHQGGAAGEGHERRDALGIQPATLLHPGQQGQGEGGRPWENPMQFSSSKIERKGRDSCFARRVDRKCWLSPCRRRTKGPGWPTWLPPSLGDWPARRTSTRRRTGGGGGGSLLPSGIFQEMFKFSFEGAV